MVPGKGKVLVAAIGAGTAVVSRCAGGGVLRMRRVPPMAAVIYAPGCNVNFSAYQVPSPSCSTFSRQAAMGASATKL